MAPRKTEGSGSAPLLGPGGEWDSCQEKAETEKKPVHNVNHLYEDPLPYEGPRCGLELENRVFGPKAIVMFHGGERIGHPSRSVYYKLILVFAA